MARPASLETALRRLASALDQLEAASGRLAQTGAEKADLQEVLAVMQDDRSRLALELDAALSRTQTLEHATDDVAARLSNAGSILRRLLESADDERG
jgi:putative heme degradation protein